MKTKFINVSKDKQLRQELRTRARETFSLLRPQDGHIKEFTPHGEMIFGVHRITIRSPNEITFHYTEGSSIVTLNVSKLALTAKLVARLF